MLVVVTAEFLHPRPQHGYHWLGQRRAPFFPAFPFTADVGSSPKHHVTPTQHGNFREPETGLHGKEQDCVVPTAKTGALIDAGEDGFDLLACEVTDERSRHPFIRDREDALDERAVLRHFECGVVIKRPQRRQPGISAARSVSSLTFELIEEGGQERSVELDQGQLRRRCSQPLLRVAHEQAEGLRVGRNRARARTPLRDQAFCKKRLTERCEGGLGLHRAPPSQRASRSRLAADINSGVFVRYQ